MNRSSWLPIMGMLMYTPAIPEAAASVQSAADRIASQSSIPAPYRGRWAPSDRACRVAGPQTEAVEVTATGWTSFENGSRVSAPGQVVRGTLYHEVSSFGSDGESRRGTLALRLAGNRLAMSEIVAGRTVHRHLIRCTLGQTSGS
jgi:hypothetical protein